MGASPQRQKARVADQFSAIDGAQTLATEEVTDRNLTCEFVILQFGSARLASVVVRAQVRLKPSFFTALPVRR